MSGLVMRIFVGMLILLVMPVAVWSSGWHWEPGGNVIWLKTLYLFTASMSRPWYIITNLLLVGWFLWCLRLHVKAAIVMLIVLFCTLALGQGIKNFIKEQVREPRPFVVWLDNHGQFDGEDFYSLPGKARVALVKSTLQKANIVPEWLGNHWQHETGFAFPSGHSMFAATWALLAIGLLWPRRYYKSVAIIITWSIILMGSRLALGMHWPRDLIASICISGVLVTLSCAFIQRKCAERKQINYYNLDINK